MNYMDVLTKRRSVYQLTNQLPISEEELISHIEKVLELSPTAFNMQSSRALLLLGQEHTQLWSMTMDILRAHTTPEQFVTTKEKLERFLQGTGTILFFEDTKVVEQYKEQYTTYASYFDTFAAHGQGIVQINMWNMLVSYGMSAHIQHYNPLIDEAVQEKWQVPTHYRLVAQLVFGMEGAPAPAIEKIAGKDRLVVKK